MISRNYIKFEFRKSEVTDITGGVYGHKIKCSKDDFTLKSYTSDADGYTIVLQANDKEMCQYTKRGDNTELKPIGPLGKALIASMNIKLERFRVTDNGVENILNVEKIAEMIGDSFRKDENNMPVSRPTKVKMLTKC